MSKTLDQGELLDGYLREGRRQGIEDVERILKKLNNSGKLQGHAALFHDGKTWVIRDLGSSKTHIAKSNSLAHVLDSVMEHWT